MTTILELCQRLMQRHCQIADAAADLVALVAEQGQEVNLLSTLVEAPPQETAQDVLLAKAPFFLKYEMSPAMREWIEGLVGAVEARHVVLTPITEMAVHAPSEIPPVYAAEFAPDHEPIVDDDAPRSYGTTHHAPTPPNVPEGAIMVRSKDLDKPLSHIGGRKKTEMTAREWALSAHFLAYMKKPPFNDWTAEEQTAKRDAFILATPQDLRMNRWGARFSKFCRVP